LQVGAAHARNAPLAPGAHRVGVGGNRAAGAGSGARNPAVPRHDHCVAHGSGAGAVNESGPDDRHRRRRRVRGRERGGDRDLPPLGRADEHPFAHAAHAATRVDDAVAVPAVRDVLRDRNDRRPHLLFTLAYTSCWNWASSDHAGGRSCVQTIATRSARGSTQKKVDAAPAQRSVPGDPGTVASESTRTAPPYPKPFRPGGQSGATVIGVSPGGRWSRTIRATVSRLRTRCPFSSPPFNSIWAKRR